MPESHQFYGIPHPVEFLLGPNREVLEKFHEANYRDRFTAGRVLVRHLGAGAAAARNSARTSHLRVTSWASDESVRGGNRLALGLDIELNDRMHVYAPSVEGYIPISWSMDDASGLQVFEPEYPEAEILHLPAIEERVPVYEGSFRAVRDVMLGQARELGDSLRDGAVTIRGSLRYQACDDKVCYLPVTVPLEWKLRFEGHDRERVPEDLRR